MDLGFIILADNPSEWRETELDPQLIDLLSVDPRTGMLPVWAAAVYSAVDMDRWYLIRNENRDRSVRNGQGNQVEDFITRLGIPLPHRGAMRLFDMYESTETDRDSQGSFKRTIMSMKKRGKHEPLTIDQAYTYWETQRRKLRVSESDAIRLLGPMPRRHIVNGWPVGMRGNILNAGKQNSLRV